MFLDAVRLLLEKINLQYVACFHVLFLCFQDGFFTHLESLGELTLHKRNQLVVAILTAQCTIMVFDIALDQLPHHLNAEKRQDLLQVVDL